jgi:hypothetical protein
VPFADDRAGTEQDHAAAGAHVVGEFHSGFQKIYTELAHDLYLKCCPERKAMR